MTESLENKTALITGASNGIGRATAFALAERRASLYLLCRSQKKGEQLLEELAHMYPHCRAKLLVADLGDKGQVEHACQQFLATDQRLDLLINNAGLINTERRLRANGLEEMFAVNHLGHFLLTNLLLERIIASGKARIINVASDAYKFCRKINYDDLAWDKNFSTFKVYGHSKLANMLFTLELARRLQASDVTVNTLHPGAVGSELGKQNGWYAKVIYALLKPFLKSPLEGAKTTLYLAQSEQVEGVTGRYFVNCKEARKEAWASDAEAAKKLWQVSEKLLAL